jgi:hypothetical protein
LEWMVEFLSALDEFKRPVSEIRTEGKAIGFTWQMLMRASVKLKLDIETISVGEDSFDTWGLPEDHPARQPEEDSSETEGSADDGSK